ncbi:hypothetical protein ABT282_15225 [Streptomyces sp. NPDC000927]|uniref:hypothetical protein n=1 Tax=unclassified Streptomyces TaxID=2593676 RepID=UPI003318D566
MSTRATRRAGRLGAHPSLDDVAHVTVTAAPEAVAAEISLPARTSPTDAPASPTDAPASRTDARSAVRGSPGEPCRSA